MAETACLPVWYELVTPDPEGAKRFYDAVAGWEIEASPVSADYRMIGAPGGPVGGVLQLSDEMKASGARPAWLLYVGTEDVDATAEQGVARGGRVFMPPTDIEGVGRFALLGDPQGAAFYVMRLSMAAGSPVFAPGVLGRCGWNELTTTDLPAALGFYGALFGWENRETMNMGPLGGYHFLDAAEVRLGAAVEMKNQPAHWNLYFTVANIDVAVARAREGGGSVDIGPHEVPTGEWIVLGRDPQGAQFALVSRGRG